MWSGGEEACALTCTGSNDLDNEDPELFEVSDGSFCVGAEFSITECTTADCINTYSTGWTGPSKDCVGGHTLELKLDTDLGVNGRIKADWSASHAGQMFLGFSFKLSGNLASNFLQFPWIRNDGETNYLGGGRLTWNVGGRGQNELYAYGDGDISADYWVLNATIEYRLVVEFDRAATPNSAGELHLFDSTGTEVTTNGSNTSINFETRDLNAERAVFDWEDYTSATEVIIYFDSFVLANTLAEARWIP